MATAKKGVSLLRNILSPAAEKVFPNIEGCAYKILAPANLYGNGGWLLTSISSVFAVTVVPLFRRRCLLAVSVQQDGHLLCGHVMPSALCSGWDI